jgi:UDP-glucose 4-epimerase
VKALITGGAGFIGHHLARHLLESGYRIDIADNFVRGPRDADVIALTSSSQARLLDVDLLNPDALSDAAADYDYIFHFAAIVGVAQVLERPEAVLRDNVTMLVRALDCARDQAQLKRFVFPSTSEVYAGTLEHFGLPLPTPESTPLALPDLGRPRTAYMLSKVYGEALCQHAGVPFTILRPHNVYGPRMGLSHVVPELMERAHHARDNDVLEVFSIDHRRTFCYIDDAVALLAAAARAPECDGETLNLGREGPEITIGELAALITDVVGKPLRIVAGPDTEGSPLRRCPDMRRTVELTGYRPRVALREGVEKTYAWYRGNVFGGRGVYAR